MRQFARVTLSFLAALLLTAGVAFGQNNSAAVTQNGSGSNAEVDQTGGSSATIEQTNDDLTLLDQSGGSSATIVQEAGQNAVVGLEEGAAFTQEGGSVLQVTSQDVAFGGAGNTVRGTQRGSDNFADIDQHNASFTRLVQDGVGNEASLQQYLGNPQEILLNQEGNNNLVDVLQTGGQEGSFADIDQTGDQNVVDGLADARKGEISIEGPDSRATQVNGDQILELTQTGNGSELYMRQSGRDGAGFNEIYLKQSDGAYGEIQQFGDGNLVDGVNGRANSNSSTALVNQVGTSNTLQFEQSTAGNRLDVTQNGTGNTATVTQN
jgi:hypothetical protein